MRRLFTTAWLLCAAMLFPHTASSAEMPTYQTTNTRQVDLSAQVARLEQVVVLLQQQVALLQSVIRINGTTVEISSSRDMKIKAVGSVNISSGLNTDISSGLNSAIKSGASTLIKSGTTTDIYAGAFLRLQGVRGEISASSDLLLKGGLLRLNKGNKPVATMGSMVIGNQVTTGSPTIFGE